MEKVLLIGCGAYMDDGYGCPGEWRCLKAAASGDGTFGKATQVMGLLRCECPGRTLAPNAKMFMKLSEMKPDKIYLSTCMAKAQPKCPYAKPEDLARMISEKTGVKDVVLGTHNYV